MTRHFLSSNDLSAEDQQQLIARSIELKRNRANHGAPRGRELPIDGKSVALIFEKASTRTRVSFETAIFELGGHPIPLRTDEIQLGRGEPLEDTARVLSRYVHGIVVRTYGQERIERLAEFSTVPVINALTDLEHPCQALADVMTILEHMPREDVRLAYVGDGNNVCHSLLLAGAKAGFDRVTVGAPPGYEPEASIVETARSIGRDTGTEIGRFENALDAAKDATVIYTDVWASMGQEAESKARLQAFEGFAVDDGLLSVADKKAIVMHCLPAHRGEEIAASVIDGPQSVVWDQAENRLHTQKALLEMLITDGGAD